MKIPTTNCSYPMKRIAYNSRAYKEALKTTDFYEVVLGNGEVKLVSYDGRYTVYPLPIDYVSD